MQSILLKVIDITTSPPSRVIVYLVIILAIIGYTRIKSAVGCILVYLLTFFDIVVSYIRHDLRNEKYNLILLWFPMCQCVGKPRYFLLFSTKKCSLRT